MQNAEGQKDHAFHTDAGDYCRQIEAYLCKKNDGHLIRIVGPSFEKVVAWAEQGIPFKVACRGIDRYFDRYYAKGPRRRPVHIGFCEADVLEAFEEWRRAVLSAGVETGTPLESPSDSLPRHLQRVISRLTSVRAQTGDARVGDALDRALDELNVMHTAAGRLRGEARATAIERLNAIEAELTAVLRSAATPDALEALTAEADAELRGYASRMPAAARAQAMAALVDKQLRENAGVGRLRYE
jgi:hypothetical protein